MEVLLFEDLKRWVLGKEIEGIEFYNEEAD